MGFTRRSLAGTMVRLAGALALCLGAARAEAWDPAGRTDHDDAAAVTAAAGKGLLGAGASWVESAAGVDFGLVDFGIRGVRREWNLGIGRALGLAPSPRRSFLGIGLSVSRPARDDPFAPPPGTALDGVGVRPWIGGCVNCPLGEIVQLGLELKWAPGTTALMDGGDLEADRRVGLSIGFRW